MKRIRISLLILTIAVAVGIFLWRNLNHTGQVELKDFALKNPKSITKIFYAPNNASIPYLEMEKDANGIWWVKNKKTRYKADTASIHDLLYYIMENLQVKNPVNDAALEAINREMALQAVKAQFYSGTTLVKTIYAGGPTYDQYGTYMYLPKEGNDKKHDRPCVVIVPGHNGFVTPYFNTDINNWRTPALLDIKSNEIQSLHIKWTENRTESFFIEKIDGEFVLKNESGRQMNVNRNRLLSYLDMFTWVTREGGEIAGINNNKESKSALFASKPFFTIDILDNKGKRSVLNLYYRPITEETYSQESKTGELKTHEIETYWGVLGGTDEIWVVQDAILKNRMRKLSDFMSK